MANASKAKIAANARYNSKTFDVLQCRVKKSENINQRIDDAVKAIQEATGNDKYSKAAFILDAIRAKLDNPQPVQAPQPQPDTPPATPAAPNISPDMECVSVLSPVDQRVSARIDGAVKYGYGVSRDRYILDAILSQLRQDEATERRKRAQAEQARLDAYYANMPDNWDDPEPDY